jgi:UDP-N-acetylglucosamine acyltransferase
MSTIHPTAIIAPTAVIGDGADIGPYCIVEDGVVIGAGARLDSHVRVLTGARIGDRCRLHHGVCIADLPQSISFDHAVPTFVEIGDDTEFREFCTVHRATTESYTTRIGSGCRFLAYSHVPHDAQIGDGVTFENFVQMGGHTHVGDHTVIRAAVTVHQFTHIGRYCDIRDSISKDVPPFLRYERFRLSSEHRQSINEELLRAGGYADADIETIRTLYAILYRTGLNVSKAVEEIAARLPDNLHAQAVITFIHHSKRGLIAGRIQ